MNELTIRLGEIAEQIDHLREREWELAHTRYELPFGADDLQPFMDLAQQAPSISKNVGRCARALSRCLQTFAKEMEGQDAIAERRALAITDRLFAPTLDDSEYGEFFSLVENQRYHWWVDNLNDIDDAIRRLGRQLIPFAQGEDARRDLKRLGHSAAPWWHKLRMARPRPAQQPRSFLPDDA